MEITSLNCNNCGANLEINPNIKFFTCTFCKSSLTIKKSGNVMFTEVLDEIKNDTETLVVNSEEMLIEKKIARLDREWMIESQQYQLKGNKGGTYYPENSNEIAEGLGGVFALVFGIVWVIGASAISATIIRAGAPGILSLFPLFGVVVIIIGIFQMIGNSKTKKSYHSAKSRYLNERTQLLTELDRNKKK